MKKIIITTGGTGGHIFPAEAIAKGLLDAGYDITFIRFLEIRNENGSGGVRLLGEAFQLV